MLTEHYFNARRDQLKVRAYLEYPEPSSTPLDGSAEDPDIPAEVARGASTALPWTSLGAARIDASFLHRAPSSLVQDSDSASTPSTNTRRWSSSHSPVIPDISLGSLDLPYARLDDDVGENSPLGPRRFSDTLTNHAFDGACTHSLTSKCRWA